MKTALIVGATGLVGSELVNELAANDEFEKIYVFSRRSLNFSHPKLENRIINFEQMSQVEAISGIDMCFCALGTTQGKSGKNGLFKVDHDYVVETANWCKTNGVPTFAVVSSIMANAQGSSFYLRTKGKMEQALMALQFPELYIFRPSLLTGKREEFRWAEKMGEYLYRLFQPIMVGKLRKLRSVSGLQVALCMIDNALQSQQGSFIIESDKIQNY